MTLPLRVLGRVAPSRQERADVLFGWPLLAEYARLGVGSAIAVRERDVVAAQADEPLLAVIARAGELCRRRRWTLLVSGAAEPGVLHPLAAARGRCLAFAAPGGAANHEALVGA